MSLSSSSTNKWKQMESCTLLSNVCPTLLALGGRSSPLCLLTGVCVWGGGMFSVVLYYCCTRLSWFGIWAELLQSLLVAGLRGGLVDRLFDSVDRARCPSWIMVVETLLSVMQTSWLWPCCNFDCVCHFNEVAHTLSAAVRHACFFFFWTSLNKWTLGYSTLTSTVKNGLLLLVWWNSWTFI